MWIAVMTVVIASAVYYIGVFYRHLQSASTRTDKHTERQRKRERERERERDRDRV